MKKTLSLDLLSHLEDYAERYSQLRPNNAFPEPIEFIEEYEALKETEGDAFFGRYGVGNHIFDVNRPFDRARAYELLLHLLQQYDPVQYLKIHKGTPYYFLSWTAAQSFNFEKAMFYMDAAVSEDIRLLRATNRPIDTPTPAIDFMLLNENSQSVGIFNILAVSSEINSTIKNFNQTSGLSLTKAKFVSSFVKELLFSEEKKSRSILTALYTFILEYESYLQLIRFRSSEGGSIEPLVTHLFNGARILESILELKGGRGNNLESKINSLPLLEVGRNSLSGGKKLSAAFSTFTSMKNSGSNFQDYSYASSYIIRNTTGHSLIWSDDFSSEESYSVLYWSLINSIFWSIYKLWLVETN